MQENQAELLAKIDDLESALKSTRHKFKKKLAGIQSELQELRESISNQKKISETIATTIVSKNISPNLHSNSDQLNDQSVNLGAIEKKPELSKILAPQIADSAQTKNQSVAFDNAQNNKAVFQTRSTPPPPHVSEKIQEAPPKPSTSTSRKCRF